MRYFFKYTLRRRQRRAVHTLLSYLDDMKKNVALRNTVKIFMLRTERLQFTMKLVLSKWAYRRSVLVGQVRARSLPVW